MMKDTLITAKTKKREGIVFVLCFLFANGMNVYSILHYGSSWSELWTQLHVVALVTLLLYIFTLLIRFMIWGTKFAYRTLKKKR
jgi:hypothetical protein